MTIAHRREIIAMNPPDPEPISVPPPVPGAPADPPSTARGSGSPRRIALAALVAGVTAGMAAWLGGEAIHGAFNPVETYELLASGQMDRLNNAARNREATLAFGMLGGALGLALGLAGGLARRSARAAAIAAAVGLPLGVAVGVVPALVLLPIADANREKLTDGLILPLLIHAGLWSAIGAAGGWALGNGAGGPVARAVLGGLLGAVVATVIYELVGALAFPLAQTGRPLAATWGTRLLARLAVATLTAGGAAWAAAGPSRRPPIPEVR